MQKEKKGPILTSTRIDVLQGGYDATCRQAEKDHQIEIRRKIKPAIYNLQTLFLYLGQSELEHPDAFSEGFDHNDTDPISWQRHNRNGLGGYVEDVYKAASGAAWEGKRISSEQPDVVHEIDRRFGQLSEPQKASPETQEALIDAIAFLCRAGEAGELKVNELVEAGLQRYWDERQERRPYESQHVVAVTGDLMDSAYGNALEKIRNGEKPTRLGKNSLPDDFEFPDPPKEWTDEELEAVLRDEATVNDGIINFGESLVVDVDESDIEAVIEALLSSGVDEVAARLIEENGDMPNPIPAHNVVDFLQFHLAEKGTIHLAESAGVTVDEFRTVLSEATNEIAERLSDEYDIIGNRHSSIGN